MGVNPSLTHHGQAIPSSLRFDGRVVKITQPSLPSVVFIPDALVIRNFLRGEFGSRAVLLCVCEEKRWATVIEIIPADLFLDHHHSPFHQATRTTITNNHDAMLNSRLVLSSLVIPFILWSTEGTGVHAGIEFLRAFHMHWDTAFWCAEVGGPPERPAAFATMDAESGVIGHCSDSGGRG
jgi:hypothetical protein